METEGQFNLFEDPKPPVSASGQYERQFADQEGMPHMGTPKKKRSEIREDHGRTDIGKLEDLDKMERTTKPVPKEFRKHLVNFKYSKRGGLKIRFEGEGTGFRDSWPK